VIARAGGPFLPLSGGSLTGTLFSDATDHTVSAAIIDLIATGPAATSSAYLYTANVTGTDMSADAGLGTGNTIAGAGGATWVYTGNADTGTTGAVHITSGNSANGDSGDVLIGSGTAGGTRGNISLDAPVVKLTGYIQTGAGNGFAMQTPDTNDGTMTGTMQIWSGNTSGGGNSGIAGIGSGDVNNSNGNTGTVWIWSGNATGGGNSGDLNLATGTSDLGTRGNIILDALLVSVPGLLSISKLATDSNGNIDLATPDVNHLQSGETYMWSGAVTAGDSMSGGAGMGTGNTNGAGASGLVEIWTGNTNGPADSGMISLGTGPATNGSSGRVVISTGAANGAGNQSGNIQLSVGDSQDGVAAKGNILLPNLPSVDPASLGALWVDAAAGFVLKVSQG
jgi:hypothetical protein